MALVERDRQQRRQQRRGVGGVDAEPGQPLVDAIETGAGRRACRRSRGSARPARSPAGRRCFAHRGCSAVRAPRRRHRPGSGGTRSPSRDLPIPASPRRVTKRVQPARAVAQCVASAALSRSRPTKAPGTPAPSGPGSAALTPVTRHSRIGCTTPRSLRSPSASPRKWPCTIFHAASLTTSVSGAAAGLHPRPDVRHLAVGEVLLPHAGADGADVDAPGVHAGAHAHLPAAGPRRAAVERLHAGEDVEPAAHGAPDVVLVRLREAEIDQHAVAQVLRDVAVVAGDRLGAHPLVFGEQLVQVLGVERLRQLGRADQVAHQHGELAPLADADRRGERPSAAAAEARRRAAGEAAVDAAAHRAAPCGRALLRQVCRAPPRCAGTGGAATPAPPERRRSATARRETGRAARPGAEIESDESVMRSLID